MKGNFVYDRLGESVIDGRRAAGMTQEDLCGLTRIDRTFLGKIENGKANPSFKTMMKISRALKVKMSVLVQGI